MIRPLQSNPKMKIEKSERYLFYKIILLYINYVYDSRHFSQGILSQRSLGRQTSPVMKIYYYFRGCTTCPRATNQSRHFMTE